MGGGIGTRVTNLLEADERIDDILGVDIDPPRRRLYRAEFRRVDPRDRRKLVKIVRDFEPTAVVHLGVYEPNARCGPALVRECLNARGWGQPPALKLVEASVVDVGVLRFQEKKYRLATQSAAPPRSSQIEPPPPSRNS